MSEFKKIIVESVQSHLDLERFANYILDRVVEKIQKNYKQNKEFADIHYDGKYSIYHFLDLVCVNYNNLKYSKKYSKEFMETIRKSGYLCIQFAKQNDTTLGEYSLKEKKIFVYLPADSNISLAVEKNTSWEWHTFLKVRRSTLIHELQHWYDAIRSTKLNFIRGDDNKLIRDREGNLIKDVKTRFNLTPTGKEYKDKFGHLQTPNDTESLDQYMKQHHEIVARFAQVASTVIRQRLLNVKDAVDYLKDEFVGWRKMPQDVQRYLIKKMTTLYYHYYPKDAKKPEIKDLIQRYVETKKSAGYSGLSVYAFGDMLELEALDVVDGENILPIIKDLIRFADIYRKNLIINELLLKKIPKNTIKELGLKENKRGKYDFRFNHDEFYRYPKRTEQISKKKTNLKNNI